MLQNIFTVLFLFEKHALYLLCNHGNSKGMNIWSTVIYKYIFTVRPDDAFTGSVTSYSKVQHMIVPQAKKYTLFGAVSSTFAAILTPFLHENRYKLPA